MITTETRRSQRILIKLCVRRVFVVGFHYQRESIELMTAGRPAVKRRAARK